MIVTIYLLVCHYGQPKLYNYWAVLSLDIFLLIFWLISFGLLAADAAAIFAYGSGTYYSYSTDSYYSGGLEGVALAWAACLAGAAGLGGVQFALFITSLAMHSVALHRHRKAGLHSSPGAKAAVTSAKVMEAGSQHSQSYQAVPQSGYMNQPTSYNSPAYDHTKPVSPMPQQQAVYPAPVPAPVYPQAPGPLTAQPTGGSYVPAGHHNAYEAPNSQMHH